MARTAADCALAYSVLTGTPVPAPRIEGLRVGVLDRAPGAGRRGRASGARRARAAPAPSALRALGARRRGDHAARCRRPTPGRCSTPTPPAAHRATFPSRRRRVRRRSSAPSSSRRRTVDPAAVARARARAARVAAAAAPRASGGPRALADARDSPSCRRPGVDELEIRVAFSAYARVFSYLGWPAIALGDTQLAGRDPAVVSSGPRWRWRARGRCGSVAPCGPRASRTSASTPTTWTRRCASTPRSSGCGTSPARTSSTASSGCSSATSSCTSSCATRPRPSSTTSASTSTTSRRPTASRAAHGLLDADAWSPDVRELNDGSVQMYLRDPAGNLVEVNWPDVTTLDRSVVPAIRRLDEERPQSARARAARLYVSA